MFQVVAKTKKVYSAMDGRKIFPYFNITVDFNSGFTYKNIPALINSKNWVRTHEITTPKKKNVLCLKS